jgi:hypothetical protein
MRESINCALARLQRELGASVDKVKNCRHLLEIEHPLRASDEVCKDRGGMVHDWVRMQLARSSVEMAAELTETAPQIR